MKEIIDLSTLSISIDRNEYLKVKGNIETNVYYGESGSLRNYSSYNTPLPLTFTFAQGYHPLRKTTTNKIL